MSLEIELLISVSPGEARCAVREGGRIVELIVERARAGPQPGDLFLGRIARIHPAANAAFVDIGGGLQLFLPAREARAQAAPDGARHSFPKRVDIAGLVNEGQAVILQVRRASAGGKAAKATLRVTLAGHHLVLAPSADGAEISPRITAKGERRRLEALAMRIAGEGPGLIVRTSAAAAGEDELRGEAEALQARWRAILAAARKARAPAPLEREPGPLLRILRERAGPSIARIILDERAALAPARAYLERIEPGLAEHLEYAGSGAGLFESEGAEDCFEQVVASTCALAGGGSLEIEGTAALTAIDVNTGGRAGSAQGRVILETNIEAAARIAEQIRLRNLGGLIVVDFVHMQARAEREEVGEALRRAVRLDPVETRVGGFTRFGLVEIVRRRTRAPLLETLTERTREGGRILSPESLALAALRAVLRAAKETPGKALRLCAAPAVVDILAGSLADARQEVEAGLGLSLELDSDAAGDPEFFEVRAV
ncbi:MAG: ribonuclease E/G [Alphaproteobacteria bacterium]